MSVYISSAFHLAQNLNGGLGGVGSHGTSDVGTWVRPAHCSVHRPPGVGGECDIDGKGVRVSLPCLPVALLALQLWSNA